MRRRQARTGRCRRPAPPARRRPPQRAATRRGGRHASWSRSRRATSAGRRSAPRPRARTRRLPATAAARQAACPSWIASSTWGASTLPIDLQPGGTRERLQHHAVALGQLDELVDLLLLGIGIEVEAQPDRTEADGRLAVDAERAAEVD